MIHLSYIVKKNQAFFDKHIDSELNACDLLQLANGGKATKATHGPQLANGGNLMK